MADRSHDWFSQGEKDLEQAAESKRLGRHEWACFAAHQSAEEVVKALHLRLGQEAWGHSVARLLVDLPEHVKAPAELVDRGRSLDALYIPTRYPNGHPEGAPFQNYGAIQSEEAIRNAGEILTFIRPQMA